MDQESLKPNTTAQQDLTFEGQRRINLIWEITQAVVAIGVTAAMIAFTFFDRQSEPMTIAFFTIITSYLTRTNHAAIGGLGTKPEAPYEGR